MTGETEVPGTSISNSMACNRLSFLRITKYHIIPVLGSYFSPWYPRLNNFDVLFRVNRHQSH
jgi:hypothetical protein